MSVAASAKMALAFAELTGGVKFDGKKHRAEMSRFRAKKNHGGGGGGSGSARSNEGASGSGRADGRDSGTASKANKKKQKDLASRKRERARGVAEHAGDDAVEVFGTRKQKVGPSSARKRGDRGSSDSDASPDDETDSEADDASDSLETGLQAALREASADAARGSRASATEEAANALRKKYKIRIRDAGGGGAVSAASLFGFRRARRAVPRPRVREDAARSLSRSRLRDAHPDSAPGDPRVAGKPRAPRRRAHGLGENARVSPAHHLRFAFEGRYERRTSGVAPVTDERARAAVAQDPTFAVPRREHHQARSSRFVARPFFFLTQMRFSSLFFRRPEYTRRREKRRR